jgi:hypothetical protein
LQQENRDSETGSKEREDWLSGGYNEIDREIVATTFLCYVDFSIFAIILYA